MVETLSGVTESSTTTSRESIKKELQLTPGHIFEDEYTVCKKLGEGGFGAVYEMEEKKSGLHCALKIESVRVRSQVIKMEVSVLKNLQWSEHAVPFHGCGRTPKFNFLLMGLVGRNLGDLKRKCPAQKFTTGTSVRLVLQSIEAVEHVHRIGYLHRDIKPSNFAIGGPHLQKTIFILDFGLARSYRTETGQLRPARESVGFRGTIRYCSLNAHRGKELGRQDDLISCLYMFVEFVKGQLPWRHVSEKKKTKFLKKTTPIHKLLEGCPEETHWIMKHLEKLNYHKEPRYEHIKYRLRNVMERKRYSEDDPLDWMEGGRYFDMLQESDVEVSTERSSESDGKMSTGRSSETGGKISTGRSTDSDEKMSTGRSTETTRPHTI